MPSAVISPRPPAVRLTDAVAVPQAVLTDAVAVPPESEVMTDAVAVTPESEVLTDAVAIVAHPRYKARDLPTGRLPELQSN